MLGIAGGCNTPMVPCSSCNNIVSLWSRKKKSTVIVLSTLGPVSDATVGIDHAMNVRLQLVNSPSIDVAFGGLLVTTSETFHLPSWQGK
jgi:hypothetical protein